MRTFLLLCVATGTAVAQSPLDRLGWLGGCWESASGSRVTVEMWLPPDGALMVGASRTVVRGQARAYEHLRLRADGEDVVYTAIPSGQAETDFRSTVLSDSAFTVENPDHDFPQRIRYRRTAPDALHVRVEGPGPDGPRGFDLVFRRMECVAEPPASALAQGTAVSRDSAAIAAAGRAFSAAYVRNDTAALGRVYSDSAALLPPNREIRGRAAIQRYFAWGADYRQLAHTMETAGLSVVGDLAIDVGTWTSTGQRGDADPTTASERYLIVWVRESDGQWRILYDMWHRPAR